MKKIAIIAALLTASMSGVAQETYENAKIANEDLNGTARYVGMGGAMEALGADISTISSNPAGIGLFRHSTLGLSFGLVSQQDVPGYASGSKTHASFDQIGFVYSTRSGRNSHINFGFNYHKSKNLDFILSAAGKPQNGSQNMQSYLKGLKGSQSNGGFNIDTDKEGTYIGYEDEKSTSVAATFNQLDYLYWNAFLVDPNTGDFGYNPAQYFWFNRKHTGYIGSYDFNISGNINDRVYLGLTFGLKDVHYNGYGEYVEQIHEAKGLHNGSLSVTDDRKITGTGFNVSAGIIVRPVEESPFRIGLSVTTPTWYDLTTENYTTLANGTEFGAYDNGNIGEGYDFKLYTPWKFGFSLGHTVGNYLALGASYEYSDYSSMDTRVNDGFGYSWYYDEYYDSSSSDKAMNNHTKKTLKGVSTIKLGAEYKPMPELAIRAGYNYVSAMYDSNGYKDGGIVSEGSYYSSSTDYTNWKGTNRMTLGVGYNINKFNIDLAYQYSETNGEFHPYTAISASDAMNNVVEKMSNDKFDVSNKRHQILLTLGYHF